MTLFWGDFFFILMWLLLLGLVLTINSLLNLFIFSEIIWVFLYIYTVILSWSYNSIFIFTIGLLILGIATCETAIGLALLILRMTIFGNIGNFDVLHKSNFFALKNKKISLIYSNLDNNEK